MVAEYWPACYLLNSRELNLRIRRSSRRKSPYAGLLIVVSQRAQICRNVHMATRTVCSSTSTSTSTSKLYSSYNSRLVHDLVRLFDKSAPDSREPTSGLRLECTYVKLVWYSRWIFAYSHIKQKMPKINYCITGDRWYTQNLSHPIASRRIESYPHGVR